MAARATAAEREPTVTILRNGQVYSPAQVPATALVMIDDRIAYVGDDATARAAASGAREVDLNGRLVTPAFVDAHLHLIQTGQLITGMDLHNCRSRDEVIGDGELVRRQPSRPPDSGRAGLGRTKVAGSTPADSR